MSTQHMILGVLGRRYGWTAVLEQVQSLLVIEKLGVVRDALQEPTELVQRAERKLNQEHDHDVARLRQKLKSLVAREHNIGSVIRDVQSLLIERAHTYRKELTDADFLEGMKKETEWLFAGRCLDEAIKEFNNPNKLS
jgi:hypothetical protein